MSGARDSLGCSAGGLSHSQQLDGSGFSFLRKRAAAQGLQRVETSAADRGYLLGIALDQGHQRHILQGRQAGRHAFAPGSFYLRAFDEPYRADFQGPMDFLLLEAPQGFLEQAAARETSLRCHALQDITAASDPVLAGLAEAMLPLLARPVHASRLLVDQLGLTFATCLLERHGAAADVALARRVTALPPPLAARAQEMLRAGLAGDVAVADIAQACGLSRSHFIRAFCAATGDTPHQWLSRQRLEMARGLLAGSKAPLAEIAVTCGYGDQSHFTRAFTRAEGMPPGAYRRALRG